MHRTERLLVSTLAALALFVTSASRPLVAQIIFTPNLVFTTVEPCRVFDTRFSTGGQLVAGVSRTFNIVGSSANFTAQGGHANGCGLPGSDGVLGPQVQAVMLNLVAVGAAGAGDIVAWPSDLSQPLSSVINYAIAGSPRLNIANGIVVLVRQDSVGNDLTLLAQVSNTHVLADVVGYFTANSPNQGGAENLFMGSQAGNSFVSTQDFNVAIGAFSLGSLTGGSANVAVGAAPLQKNTTGSRNTAIGHGALESNTSSDNNTAVGAGALAENDGARNTVVGEEALEALRTGSDNVVIGYLAGVGYFGAESSNIVIGAPGVVGESNAIRLGSSPFQTAAYIGGIAGATSSSGVAVFVNTLDQLGTTTSSIRFKEDVETMGDASDDLMKLRPVTFHYKAGYDDGSRLLQYGLIAEEVAQVLPGMVQYDSQGEPNAVRYHFVNAMLLNEVQKQHLQIQNQHQTVEIQAAAINQQRSTISELTAQLAEQQTAIHQLMADRSRQQATLGELLARMEALEAISSRAPAPR